MSDTLSALQAQIDDLRARIERPRKRNPEIILNCRISAEDMKALDAIAMQRGLSRSDTVREILGPVIGRVIETHRHIPDNFRRQRNRTKPTHYADQRTNDHERNKAIAREAEQRAVHHSLMARQAMHELSAATHNAPVVANGRLSEATIARGIPKLGR